MTLKRCKDITSSAKELLVWMAKGHYIDLCVDICCNFGELSPSGLCDLSLHKRKLKALLVKGYIVKTVEYVYGVQYTRYRISTNGLAVLKGHHHDTV